MISNNFFSNIRFYVICASIVFSLGILCFVLITIPTGSLQIIRLTQLYALVGVAYLYVTLLTTPITRLFTSFPFRAKYLVARRSMGVSSLYFALLHSCFAFFGQLGGFPGLFFLDNTYLLAISLSFAALIILLLMASTSFDIMVAKLTFPRWKILHRFVYLAAMLIVIHALLLGTHFSSLSQPVAQISFLLLIILLTLESIRFDTYIKLRFPLLPQVGVITICYLMALIFFTTTTFQTNSLTSFGIHSQHEEELSRNTMDKLMPNMQGNKNLRFNVSIKQPQNISENQDTTFEFQVNDARNGNIVRGYTMSYEKLMHIIVVDNSLTYFRHLHGTLNNNIFTLTTQFPKPGLYRLYLSFQPFGAIEQQFAFTVWVGEQTTTITTPDVREIDKHTDLVDNYSVTLKSDSKLSAKNMSDGKQHIEINITDSQTNNPITNLKPYLGAFGHLTMINTSDYSFIHVHPAKTVTPNQIGGPIVDFIPMSMLQPFTPGIYKVFAELNPNGSVVTSDFTISIP